MDELIRCLNNSFCGKWFEYKYKTIQINHEHIDGFRYQHDIAVEFKNIYTREKHPFIRVKMYSTDNPVDIEFKLKLEAANWLMNSILFSKETNNSIIDGVDGHLIKTFADIKKEILEYKSKTK